MTLPWLRPAPAPASGRPSPQHLPSHLPFGGASTRRPLVVSTQCAPGHCLPSDLMAARDDGDDPHQSSPHVPGGVTSLTHSRTKQTPPEGADVTHLHDR